MHISLSQSRNRYFSAALISLALFVQSVCYAAASGEAPDFTGKWNVTVRFGTESASAVLELTQENGKYQGTSGPLDENGYLPLTYEGALQNKRLSLKAAAPKGFPERVGALDLEIKNKQLVGKGTLYTVPVTLIGVRPDVSPHTPKTYEFVPTSYIVNLNGRNAPVLHIYPGDSVKTTTVDANGMDNNREFASMPGNPHTGPFYIEGAMPGDTLVVHLTSVRINQTRAEMYCRELSSAAFPSWFERPKREAECDWHWTLDAATHSATPTKASSPRPHVVAKLRKETLAMIEKPGAAEPPAATP